MNDIVTVVTVTYNAEELLEETILSVINQSYYDNIEYIIIDGASTDKTIDIIKKYEDKISYWISEADEGIYFAMNKGIEKATGKWINFMNAGDTFAGKEIVAYVMKYKENDAELIYGDYQIKENGLYKKAYDRSQWYKNMPFCHQALFTQTKSMKETLFDTCYNLAADYNFILKMHIEKKNFCYLEKSIALFDTSGFAISNQLLMYIESLTVLLRNSVSKEEIEQAEWYFNLKKDMSIHQIEKQSIWIKKQEKTIEEKEQHIKKQSKWIEEQEKVIKEKTTHVLKQSAWIKEQEQMIKKKDIHIKKQSDWIIKQEEVIKETEDRFEYLKEPIEELATIRFLYHPLTKIQKYNKLMDVYHKIKK